MHFTTLLIEPPGTDSQLINLILAPEKFHVKTAECGTDAWNLIIESDPPDLVIIDTDIPLKGNVRIGAAQLMDLMSQLPQWHKTPKLMLTSDASSTVFQQASKKGVCAAILKPYDPRRFIHEIHCCIRKQLDAHIKEVNRQHIELGTEIRNVAKIYNQDAIKAKLKEILNGVERHFAFEEAYMLHHYYADLEEHRTGHEQIYSQAKKLIDDICQGGQVITGDKLDQIIATIFDGVDDDKKYIGFLYELLESLTSEITTGSKMCCTQR
ncbi:MAG: response regulator [Candidatus Thiodiazotropha sp.]